MSDQSLSGRAPHRSRLMKAIAIVLLLSVLLGVSPPELVAVYYV